MHKETKLKPEVIYKGVTKSIYKTNEELKQPSINKDDAFFNNLLINKFCCNNTIELIEETITIEEVFNLINDSPFKLQFKNYFNNFVDVKFKNRESKMNYLIKA